jgi:signal transduction histidine kinase
MPIASDARRILDDIADALVEEWGGFRVDAISRPEVAATVADVVQRIAEAADGVTTPESLGSPLQRKVLSALRRRLIKVADAANAADLLVLLRGIEQVAATFEAGWSERFEERLTGPSGLDLVVEVAHDLRSPLTSILFLSETMMRGRSGPLTALQERQLGLVYSAAFGLNAVASDVIELVRGGDRLMGRDAQPFSITEVLEAVGDIVLPIAEEKGLTLEFTGPLHDRRVGHGGALNRVLLNLTTNGLKFTSQGGVHVEVKELDPAHPERIRCSVQDTGRGIPEAAIPMLFEPFRRRQQAGDYAFSGSGLGLSICRKLVEAMGSSLNLETVQGQGTRFTFDVTLPLMEQDSFIG